MTPNDIEILIHCYVCPAPHERQAQNEGVFARLVRDGLIEPEEGRDFYRTTPRGDAHVMQMCNLPYPQNAWISSNGALIKSTPRPSTQYDGSLKYDTSHPSYQESKP